MVFRRLLSIRLPKVFVLSPPERVPPSSPYSVLCFVWSNNYEVFVFWLKDTAAREITAATSGWQVHCGCSYDIALCKWGLLIHILVVRCMINIITERWRRASRNRKCLRIFSLIVLRRSQTLRELQVYCISKDDVSSVGTYICCVIKIPLQPVFCATANNMSSIFSS